LSCAKTAETIEIQFRMLSWVGPEDVLHGDVAAFIGRGTCGDVWLTAKHCKCWGSNKKVRCAKNGWTDILMMYKLYDIFSASSSLLRGVVIAPSLNIY